MISKIIVNYKERANKSRLLTDSFWAIFGNIIGKGLALAAGILVARFLGKDIFGEYGIIRNTLMSIAIFSTFGLGYTATKYVAEYKISKPEYIFQILRISRDITLGVSGFMAIGLFLGATYISEIILEAPHLDTPLKLTSIWVIFNAVTTMQIGIIAGFGDFKGMAWVNTITGIATFILSFIFTYLWHLNGALLSLLLAQILNWYLNYILVRKNLQKIPKVGKGDKLFLKEIITFSLPIALQEALYSVSSWVTLLILVRLSTYGELGLYSAAIQWSAIILFVPGAMRNVILSHLSQSENNKYIHERVLKITLLINFLMTFIPFLLFYIFSEFIANFYGVNFNGLKEVINIAILGTVFMSLSNVYAQAYMSKGKNWLMFVIRLIRDFGIIFTSYFLLKNISSYPGAIILTFIQLIVGIAFLFLMAFFYHFGLKKT